MYTLGLFLHFAFVFFIFFAFVNSAAMNMSVYIFVWVFVSSYLGVEFFPGSSAGKESACNVGDLGSVPSWEDPLEEGMATHSGILAWRIPQTEEPGGLQSKRSQRLRYDWVTKVGK